MTPYDLCTLVNRLVFLLISLNICGLLFGDFLSKRLYQIIVKERFSFQSHNEPLFEDFSIFVLNSFGGNDSCTFYPE